MPTLTQPAIGSTAWGSQMNSNLQVLQIQLTNAMQGRIQRDSATQISLQQYSGDTVEVGGLNTSIGASGLVFNATTTNTITSTGADSGAKVAASTLYYVYVSNANASSFPSSLSLSTQAYTYLGGVRYLGSSGNAANWRFIGWVQTNGSIQFVDTEWIDGTLGGQRWVVNYYNRIWKPVLATPAYSNGSTTTTYSKASGGNWSQANGGSGSRFSFIANGEDAVGIQAVGCIFAGANGSGFVGIGIDSTSDPSKVARNIVGTGYYTVSCVHHKALSEGNHDIDLLVQAETSAASYAADFIRLNASADLFTTYITALVPV